MGVIQNAINQMLGTVGVAARLSPGYETRQELHKLRKQEKALNLQQEALPSIDGDEMEEGRTIAAKQHKELLEKQADVAQRQFELKPTKENMRKATFARSGAGEDPLFVIPADPEEIMMEQANMKAAEKSTTRQTQKRNFMNYLKNIEIQGGGTVGDLPPHLQKVIAKQYTKSERKQLMDKGDARKDDTSK